MGKRLDVVTVVTVKRTGAIGIVTGKGNSITVKKLTLGWETL